MSTTQPAARKSIRVGDALVERGVVTAAQIEDALAAQDSGGRRKLLGEILVERNCCTQAQLTAALADAYGIPFVNLKPKFADPACLHLLPRDFIEERFVLPLFMVDGVLTVAVTEPSNVFLIEEIEQRVLDTRRTQSVPEATGSPSRVKDTVQIVAALREDILETLDQLSPDDSSLSFEELYEDAVASSSPSAAGESDRADLEELGTDSPVVQLVNHTIHTAIREGASDIHFEPDEAMFRIRYRIDGQLIEKLHPPVQMQAAIVARIKIMAGMDISERRLPQDGAIRVTSRGRPIDLRVSTLPNKHGEKVVIRIIDNSNALISLDGLDLSEDVRANLTRLSHQPYGLILVTGPTGSGKSTTLYSMLNEINSPTINICTVEDPIEFNLKGVNQFQVHEKIGLSFAAALRTLLRQDPDVIMVGEIRDPETARIGVQAALTGHLVLSTLHTNDSAGAVTRMENLAVEPYLISAALIGVVAQRLVRKVCNECRTEVAPTPAVAHAAERAGFKLDKVARGRGCTQCNQTGMRGRIGLYEVLVPHDEMRSAIATGADLGKLRQLASRAGMKTLFEYGMEKVKAGITTVEEVLRVTST